MSDKNLLPNPNWRIEISSNGLSIHLSREVMSCWSQTLRRVLPWVLTALTAFGGTAGVRLWLLQQPDPPATSPTEDVYPQP